MSSLEPFLYSIRKKIEAHQLKQKSFLVLVSGGLDSMVLLDVFCQLAKANFLQFRVLHLHHGKSNDRKQNQFRDKALLLVKDYCVKHKISFLHREYQGEKALHAEEDLRNFRMAVVDDLKTEQDIIVSGHHWQDVFETRFMRLLRGSGTQGFISMKILQGQRFRPFLDLKKQELKKYAQKHQLKYIEDPSNEDTKYLRNWLRVDLFPQLEKKRQGSLANMAKSFDILASTLSESRKDWSYLWSSKGLCRLGLLALDKTHQFEALSAFLNAQNVFEFRRSQLDEVLKRLDNRQNEYKFKVMTLDWQVSAENIEIIKNESN